ncbi:hypothetical protein HELRODRAFT_182626 [Helobdella robusta]|uniref:Uncharacterized protein n=1 Tax=Helobdella robusta TaxID=6412 RepID=T1FIH9_HELRO|nr:hypothetical protein HELRODRAFT_182626 [Helobdella robusta]ESN90795.1 hypothetical protein HELRODRAFT_182626 [Helobdella robusta]
MAKLTKITNSQDNYSIAQLDHLGGYKILTNVKNKSLNDGKNNDSSFEIKPLTCTWKKNLVLFYLDDDMNDGFIADEDEFFIAASLINRKDVNEESYNMHQRYPSGHPTPRKLNRKKALASSDNKINKGPRHLPMARGTETTKTWREPKRNNTGFKRKTWLSGCSTAQEKNMPGKILKELEISEQGHIQDI